MFRFCLVSFLALFLSACAVTSDLNVRPISGVELSFPVGSPFLMEMLDGEVLFYQDKKLVGSIQRVPVTDERKTAIESLQDGIEEAKKGSNKPTVLDLSPGSFGFVVHTIDFSTVFLATNKDPANWVVLGINKDKYEDFIGALRIVVN